MSIRNSARYLGNAALGDSSARMQIEEMKLQREQLQRQGMANALQQITGGVVGGIGAYEDGQRKLKAQAQQEEQRAFQRKMAEEASLRADAADLRAQEASARQREAADRDAERFGLSKEDRLRSRQEKLLQSRAPILRSEYGDIDEISPEDKQKLFEEMREDDALSMLDDSQIRGLIEKEYGSHKDSLAKAREAEAKRKAAAERAGQDKRWRESQINKNNRSGKRSSGSGSKRDKERLRFYEKQSNQLNGQLRSIESEIGRLKYKRDTPNSYGDNLPEEARKQITMRIEAEKLKAEGIRKRLNRVNEDWDGATGGTRPAKTPNPEAAEEEALNKIAHLENKELMEMQMQLKAAGYGVAIGQVAASLEKTGLSPDTARGLAIFQLTETKDINDEKERVRESNPTTRKRGFGVSRKDSVFGE